MNIKEIIFIGKKLKEQGLIQACSGNISCRLGDGSLLITAGGVDKGALEEADILSLAANGHCRSAGRPSSETALHLALYQAIPEIQAIVHAHPPYATALASAGRALDWQLLEESRLFLGPVPLIPSFPAGSAELAQAAGLHAFSAPEETHALLLAGHGAVSWGENLQQAMYRMEILEHTARVMLYTRLWQNI